ncbi:hypothetical protein [Clostridium sp. KNHs216]|uniref:hypothetical protein n=1 Tax=Clostridium sp. KNHs216 TaxID=1550235 RepID=UPI001150BC2D|nr:hypothetical protein [Clostridium sp. KNHs216]TQI67277.1 hypothetical protein LY85_1964 [Clostridium sp. KNHs216]
MQDHKKDYGTKNLDTFPAMDFASVEFPKEEFIAYAVCGKECGTKEFIVDGETQVCARCGNPMFRTDVRKYLLAEEDGRHNKSFRIVTEGPVELKYNLALEDYPEVESNSVLFPKEIYTTFVVCTEDCGACGFIVEGQADICEYCGHHMLHTEVRKYILQDPK